MTVATAGSPLSFFIIARDKGSSLVHQAFDGVLPWRVTGDVYVPWRVSGDVYVSVIK